VSIISSYLIGSITASLSYPQVPKMVV